MTNPKQATDTGARSYREEAEDDASSAVWELEQYKRGGNALNLERAARFVRMAIKRETYSLKLANGQLENY